MTRYPYPIGAKIAGADCSGKAFTGTVTELLGPYTVKIDGLYATPVVLIHGLVDGKQPDLCIDCDGQGKYPSGAQCISCGGSGRVLPGDGIAVPEPAAQLSLF